MIISSEEGHILLFSIIRIVTCLLRNASADSQTLVQDSPLTSNLAATIIFSNMDARLRRVNKEITGISNSMSWRDIANTTQI